MRIPKRSCLILLGLAFLSAFVSTCGSKPSRPPIQGILLVSLDTCRADYLGCYGYPDPITPHIDRIASEGIRFSEAVSPVPLTLPSHCTLLTGTIPPYHGVHDNLNYRLGPSNVSLAEILAETGFRTGAVIGSTVLDSEYGLNQGFDMYQEQFDQSIKGMDYAQRRGDEVSRYAIDWLGKLEGETPFFLFVHYYDPHYEYDPPEPFRSQYKQNPYAGEIAFTDHCLGRVLDELKRLGRYDSTLIIITADHGESLGEHGEQGHGYFIYQSTQRVPFIVRLPGGSRGGTVIDRRVALADIAPTVLGLLDIDIPGSMQGIDLSAGLENSKTIPADRDIYVESLTPTKYACGPLFGIVQGPWKYIQTTRPELYRLDTDPAETENLIENQPIIARELQQRLKTILETEGRFGQTDSEYVPDPVMISRLESLGYVAGRAVEETFEFDRSKDDPKDYIALHEAAMKALQETARLQFESARSSLFQVLEQRPEMYEMYERLGQLALARGQFEEAVKHFSEFLTAVTSKAEIENPSSEAWTDSLKLRPNLAKAHLNLGTALSASGRPGEAVRQFEDSVREDPEYPDARYNLASTLARLGRMEEAIAEYRETLRLKPGWDIAANNLAWLLATVPDERLRDGAEAVRLAEEISRLRGNEHPAFLNTLAAAYAEDGQFNEAAETARRAAEVARSKGNRAYAEKVEEREKLYRAGRPFRQ